MKCIARILCVALLAVPLLANAFSVKNETPYSMSFKLNGYSTNQSFEPNQTFSLSDEEYHKHCGSDDCTLNVYSEGMPNHRVLITVILNPKGEVKAVTNYPYGKKVMVNSYSNSDVGIIWDDSIGAKK